MCFSVEADVVAGVVILPVAVASLLEVRLPRELPFASLPLLLAAHQLVEAVVWAGAEDRSVSPGLQQAAVLVYVGFAMVVLPTLFPLAVLLLEPVHRRGRVAPFLALGVVVSFALGVGVFSGPVDVIVHAHALEYVAGLDHGVFWAVLYVVAVIGPSVLSGYRSVVAFGLANLAGLVVVAGVYREAFASLWCVYAALTSVFVLLHMVLRRRLPDADRMEGFDVVIGRTP